jgi:hypothetical protein
VDNIKMDLRERENAVLWTGFIWLMTGNSAALLWTWSKPPASVKFWDVLERLQDWWSLEKGLSCEESVLP